MRHPGSCFFRATGLVSLLGACDAGHLSGSREDAPADVTGDALADASSDMTDARDASRADAGEAPAEPCFELVPSPGAPSSRWDAATFDVPAPLRLNLPLAAGAEAVISQGPDGGISHLGAQRFAWDFDVPGGTEVFAVAGGVVVDVVADSTTWGMDPSYRNLANRVILDHGRGLFSAYVHLGAGEVEVTPGQWAAAGDLLGRTGLSGQMSGPHLHFHVENAWSETRPVRFFGGSEAGCTLVPQVGDTVRVPPVAPFGDALEPSQLPADTFAEFGVDAVEGLPARIFSEGAVLTVRGVATDPDATHVHLLMLPPEGGMALGVWSFPIAADRGFVGEASPGDLGVGRYAWALAAGQVDSARVTRSVRCVVVPADAGVAGL
jgi:murein DD-endopeptidase MepM/ murein hydrolase activator NlpD